MSEIEDTDISLSLTQTKVKAKQVQNEIVLVRLEIEKLKQGLVKDLVDFMEEKLKEAEEERERSSSGDSVSSSSSSSESESSESSSSSQDANEKGEFSGKSFYIEQDDEELKEISEDKMFEDNRVIRKELEEMMEKLKLDLVLIKMEMANMRDDVIERVTEMVRADDWLNFSQLASYYNGRNSLSSADQHDL